MVKNVANIKKIRLHYHKTQMSGVCSSNFNNRYKLYNVNVNVERSRSIEYIQTFSITVTLQKRTFNVTLQYRLHLQYWVSQKTRELSDYFYSMFVPRRIITRKQCFSLPVETVNNNNCQSHYSFSRSKNFHFRQRRLKDSYILLDNEIDRKIDVTAYTISIGLEQTINT